MTALLVLALAGGNVSVASGRNSQYGVRAQQARRLIGEDGKLAYPVSEITVSSNLDRMLQQIDAIGSDLVMKTATAAPTLRIASMTIAGT